jgi:hypothetical protein
MVNFLQFIDQHPELKPCVIQTEGKESKWGRLVCHWHEKKTSLDHIFTPLINLQTGEIYLDCSKKKIYAKFITHLLLRPIHIAFKTLYHLAIPLSIPYIVYKSIKEGKEENQDRKKIAQNCLKNCVKSLADIVRTPLYGIAMIIVNVAALVIGPLAPKTLYDFREMTGKLIPSLSWQKTFVEDDIFPCFQAFENLQNINNWDTPKEDTIYPSANAYLRGLSNFARSQIKFRREHYAPFNNLFGKLDPNVRFVSPSYGDVEKAMASK